VVLVSETHLGADERLAAVLRGADAVVHTDASPVELAEAVAAVRRGETILDPFAARRLAAAARTGHLTARAELRLTPRELSILQSVERGESVKQTARSLGIAMKTVENLQSRMFRKLGARNRAHAVTIAHRLGLLDTVEPAAVGLSA
jgi:DNA-binding NarL/FixJ family response regulator